MNKHFYKYCIGFFVIGFFVSCTSKKNVQTTEESAKILNTKGITSVSAAESKSQYLFIKAEGYYLQQEYDKALILFTELGETKPNQAAIFYKKAQCFDKKGELSSAITQANLAVEKNNKIEDYSLYLIGLYKRTNNYQSAVYCYQNLIDHTHKEKYYLGQAELFTQMAKMESQKRDYLLGRTDEKSVLERKNSEQKVLKYYQSAIDAMNKHEQALGLRENVLASKQQIYLFLGDYQSAKKEGEKLVKLMPSEMNYKFSQAEIIAKADGLNDAIAYQRKVVEENPSSATARLVLAELYKRNNQYVFFQNELDAAFSLPEVDLTQKVKLINQMLTQSYTAESKKTAIDLAKKVVESHPDSPQSYSILGDAYLVNNEFEKARNEFAKVLVLDPYKAVIWTQILKLDAQLGLRDSLIQDAINALKIFPDETSFYLYLADAQIQNQETLKAKNTLENGLLEAKGNPALQNEFNIRLGDVYYQLKEYESCFQTYEKVLEFDPNNSLAINNYSYYLAEANGDLEKAKSLMYRVVRIFPNDLNYLDTYGWILYKKGEYVESLNYLAKASENGSGVVLEHAGDAAFKNNQVEIALEYWNKALLAGGASEDIQQKINEKKVP